MISMEYEGIWGMARITLRDNGNGTQRVRLEHVITSECPAGQELPKYKYLPVRKCGIVFPTRIIEYVDVPKGKYVPMDVADALVEKYFGPSYCATWLGRGWDIVGKNWK